MSSLIQLVDQVVDYAGLFPPAELPLAQVVENYGSYQRSPFAAMLGRLVLPASRLNELRNLEFAIPPDHSKPWRISALVPPWAPDANDPFLTGMSQVEQFNETCTGDQVGLIVDSIETRVESAGWIKDINSASPTHVELFLELDHQSDPAEAVELIAGLNAPGRFAKIRTGSVRADQVASIADVARFLACCVQHGTGLKATAGLHHPIRATYALTYQADSPQAELHGFLNMFVGSVIAFEHGLDATAIAAVLQERDADEFKFEESGLSWRQFFVTTDRVAHWRQVGIRSFGSCSFDEPTTELHDLGLSVIN